MKHGISLLLACILVSAVSGQGEKEKQQINAVIDSFYNGFRTDNFRDMSGYTTADINYIAPPGSWFKGRKQLQDSIQAVHEGMLKNTPVAVETMTLRFITPGVAIVNLIDKMGAFYPPDGVNRGTNKVDGLRTMRTMVLVKQKGKWLLAQNQSTFIGASL
jgi:uncharacterized protein (TIGR02246 family)